MDTAVLPFPAHIFEEASKTDLQNLLEVMHYAVLAETPQDVKNVLIRTKKFLPFDRLIGGLVRLNAKRTFERVFRCLEHKLSTNMAVPILEEWIWGC